MPIITLTSDYGLTDHYLPSLKGTILSDLKEVQLVDISHTIEPGNLFETAFIIRNSYAHFPKGSVHIIAVQELTPNQRLLAVEIDEHFFILADNGLISMINPDVKPSNIYELRFKTEATLFPVKDVMAPAACHLARGGALGVLGRAVKDFKQSTFMRPLIQNDGSVILGSIVYIDNFGNLITNISRKIFTEVGKDRPFVIELPRAYTIKKILENYNSASSGSYFALFNSQNLLEIAVSGARGKNYNGANSLLGASVQQTITVKFK